MRISRTIGLVCALALLTSCGGDGPSSGPIAGGPTPPTPTPPPSSTCSLDARQDWALAQLQEWYLFPDKLDTSVDKSAHATLQSYIDAVVAPARAEGIDRNFTYVTSIEAENEFFSSGANVGYGFQLGLSEIGWLIAMDVFETSPAHAAGLTRGSQIIGIGTSESNIRSVEEILNSSGVDGLINALGPVADGTTRWFEIDDWKGSSTSPNGSDGTQVYRVALTQNEFGIAPVSPEFGVDILEFNGEQMGYVNLRTFIDPASEPLANAFDLFREQGIDRIVVDFRYNGGGLVRVAEYMGDLLKADQVGNRFSFTRFRDSKAENNSSYDFRAQPEAVAAKRIAFITTDSTASASELVANAMPPYLNTDVAMVGSNTFGKPVGQIALDQAECDDRLRVVAFQTENANGEGGYYNGLESVMPKVCGAEDNWFQPMNSEEEISTRVALAFGAGDNNCSSARTSKTLAGGRVLGELRPKSPSAVQHHLPGSF